MGLPWNKWFVTDKCMSDGIPTGKTECETCGGEMQVLNEEENKWEACKTCEGTGKEDCWRCVGECQYVIGNTTCDQPHGVEE